MQFIQSKASPPFTSRQEAGRALARRLEGFARRNDTVVLAIPDGGVPVAAEIAKSLRLPLDLILIEKIITTSCRSKQLGAITSGGVRILNSAMIDHLHLSDAEIKAAILRKSLEIARRESLYHKNHVSLDLADHSVILVDDGSTSCSTLRNAIRLLHRQHVEHIIVALPATCHHAACDLKMEADDVVTLVEPRSRAFARNCLKQLPRTTLSEVRELLASPLPA